MTYARPNKGSTDVGGAPTDIDTNHKCRLILPFLIPMWRISALLLVLIGSCNAPGQRSLTDAAKNTPASTWAPSGSDPEALLLAMTELTERCSIDVAEAQVKCDAGELETLTQLFTNGTVLPVVEALTTLHRALAHEDASLVTVAANLSERAFSWGLGPQPPSRLRLSGEGVVELLTTVRKLPTAQALKVIPLLVHEAMLTERKAEVLAFLETDSKYRRVGYRHLLTYGRLAEFERLKALAASNGDDATITALEGLTLMPNWSVAEQATLCPWAKPYFADPREKVRGAAGGALSQCDTKTLRDLVPVMNTLGREAKLAPGQPLAFRIVCSTHERQADDPLLCHSVRGLLESTINYTRLKPQTRADALQALATSIPWQHDAQVSALIDRFVKSPEPILAREARRAVAALAADSAENIEPKASAGPGLL